MPCAPKIVPTRPIMPGRSCVAEDGHVRARARSSGAGPGPRRGAGTRLGPMPVPATATRSPPATTVTRISSLKSWASETDFSSTTIPRCWAIVGRVDEVDLLLGAALQRAADHRERRAGACRSRRCAPGTPPRCARPSCPRRAPSPGARAGVASGRNGPSTSMSSAPIAGMLTAVETTPPVSAATHLLGALVAGAVGRLGGRGAEVRGDDHVGVARRTAGSRSSARTGTRRARRPPTLPESSASLQRAVVDQPAARDVEDAHAVAHLRERVGVERSLRSRASSAGGR